MRPHMVSGIGAVILVLAAGCASLAVWSAPEKVPSQQRTALAQRADGLFWQILNGGEYEKIPDALTAMTAAYLADPGDAVTAARIGWLHIWRLAERARLAFIPPGITDHAVLARKYFEEAVRLQPSEARYRGFYASLLMTEGTIHKDEKLRRQGYYIMRDAVAAWPEFNYFTAGYSVSAQPHGSERFREGLEYQWLNLDVCAGTKVDRARPDFARFMQRETKEGPQRACWNSGIAPHNVEGFFLNFGDMLVKAGDPGRAIMMYRNAQRAPDYAAWPYKDVLEDRLRNATRYVEIFRATKPEAGAPTIMVSSRFACMGCHQR